MLNRVTASSEGAPEIENRAAYLFLQEIKSILSLSDVLVPSKPFLIGDGLDLLRSKLALLNRTVNLNEPIILDEEHQRQQYAVSKRLVKASKQAELEVAKAQEDLQKVLSSYEAEKTDLTQQITQTDSDINIKSLELVNQQGTKIVEDNNEFQRLINVQKDLESEKARLERVIDSKCCSCLPWRKPKEVVELQEVEEKLKAAFDAKATHIERKRERDSGQKKKEDEIKALKESLSVLREKLNKLEKDAPKKSTEARQRVVDLQIELATKKIEITKEQARHNACLSIKTMFVLLQLYIAMVQYHQEIIFVYSQSADSQSKLKKKFAELNKKSDFVKDRLDELLQQVWCAEARNKPGNTFLEAYHALSDELKNSFLRNAWTKESVTTFFKTMFSAEQKADISPSAGNVMLFDTTSSREDSDSEQLQDGKRELSRSVASL